MNADLEQAVRAGDLAAVKRLVKEEGADWQEDGQQALYLAAKEGRNGIVAFFLEELVRPQVEARIFQALMRADALFISDPPDPQLAEVVNLQVRNHMYAIETALAAPLPTARIGHAVQLRARGLFRFLAEQDPAAVLKDAPRFADAYGAYEFVRDLLAMGADIGFANGRVLANAVLSADLDAVRFLIGAGADVNAGIVTGQVSVHPLHAAAMIGDHSRRTEMAALLFAAGADIRTDSCNAVRLMAAEGRIEVCDMVDGIEQGSQMPLFLTMQCFGWRRLPGAWLERFPFAGKWLGATAFQETMGGAADMPALLAKLEKEGLGLNDEDGFLLKCAAMPGVPLWVAEGLMAGGADPNTQKDPPFRLAALLGREELVRVFAKGGADPYAQEAAAFRDARLAKNPKLAGALKEAADIEAARAEGIFYANFGAASGIEALRRETGGETGILYAARAGLLGGFLKKGAEGAIVLEDFLKPGLHGATLFSVLRARGEYKVIFSPAIWGADAAGPETLRGLMDDDEKKAAQQAFDELCQVQRAGEKSRALKMRARKFGF